MPDHIAVMTIEHNKGYLKFKNPEDLWQFFERHKEWFKYGNPNIIKIEFMDYCTYKQKKRNGILTWD